MMPAKLEVPRPDGFRPCAVLSNTPGPRDCAVLLSLSQFELKLRVVPSPVASAAPGVTPTGVRREVYLGVVGNPYSPDLLGLRQS